MKTRILAFFLTLCMILSMVPAVAFADGETTTPEATAGTTVKTAQELAAALATGATKITLGADLTVDVTAYGDVEIDLKGYALAGTVKITDGEKVTITDTAISAGSGKLTATFTGDYEIVSAKFETEVAAKVYYAAWANTSELVEVAAVADDPKTDKVDESAAAYCYLQTAKTFDYQVNSKNYVYLDKALKAAVAGDLVITADTSKAALDMGNVAAYENKDLTINLNGKDVVINQITGENVTIKNGTLALTTNNATALTLDNLTMDTAIGGNTTYKALTGYYKWDLTAAQMPVNAKQVGYWVVVAANNADIVAVIKGTDKGYATVAEALAAKKVGEVVVLVADEDNYLPVNGDATIDLGGKNITGTFIINSGIVNITNGTVDAVTNVAGTLNIGEDANVKILINQKDAVTTLAGGSIDAISNVAGVINLSKGEISPSVNALLVAEGQTVVKLVPGSTTVANGDPVVSYTVREAYVHLLKDGVVYAGYDTVEEAYAKAKAGDTIKLNKDFELANTLVIEETITLDLNGKTLTVAGAAAVIGVDADGKTVTIKDTATTKGAVAGTSNYHTVQVYAGKLVVEASITGVGTTCPALYVYNGDLEINDGAVITSTHSAVVVATVHEEAEKAANVTINGGVLTGKGYGCYAVYADGLCNLTINGGTFTSEKANAVYVFGGVDVTINGGEFSSAEDVIFLGFLLIGSSTLGERDEEGNLLVPTISITGGEFTIPAGKSLIYNEADDYNGQYGITDEDNTDELYDGCITGGTFNGVTTANYAEFVEYLADSVAPKADFEFGKALVVDPAAEYVIAVNGVKYSSWAAAWTAAVEAQGTAARPTFQAIETTTTIVAEGNIDLDLNGKTLAGLTLESNVALYIFSNVAGAKITDTINVESGRVVVTVNGKLSIDVEAAKTPVINVVEGNKLVSKIQGAGKVTVAENATIVAGDATKVEIVGGAWSVDPTYECVPAGYIITEDEGVYTVSANNEIVAEIVPLLDGTSVERFTSVSEAVDYYIANYTQSGQLTHYIKLIKTVDNQMDFDVTSIENIKYGVQIPVVANVALGKVANNENYVTLSGATINLNGVVTIQLYSFAKTVARVDDTFYATVEAAIAAAADGATVRIISDEPVSFEINCDADKDITINFNATVGHIVVVNANNKTGVEFRNGTIASLTVNGGTIDLGGVTVTTLTANAGSITVKDNAKVVTFNYPTDSTATILLVRCTIDTLNVAGVATTDKQDGWVRSDFTWTVADGKIVIVKTSEIVAMIGNVAYTSLNDATKAAKDGDIIVMINQNSDTKVYFWNIGTTVKIQYTVDTAPLNVSLSNSNILAVKAEGVADENGVIVDTYTVDRKIAYVYGGIGATFDVEAIEASTKQVNLFDLTGLGSITITSAPVDFSSAVSDDKVTVYVDGAANILSMPVDEDITVIVKSLDVTFAVDPNGTGANWNFADGVAVKSEVAFIEGTPWTMQPAEVTDGEIGYATLEVALEAGVAEIKFLTNVETDTTIELSNVTIDLNGFKWMLSNVEALVPVVASVDDLFAGTTLTAIDLLKAPIIAVGTTTIKNGEIVLDDTNGNDHFVLISVIGMSILTLDSVKVPQAFGYDMTTGITVSICVFASELNVINSTIAGSVYAVSPERESVKYNSVLSKDETSSWKSIIGEFKCGDHKAPENGKCSVCGEEAAEITYDKSQFKVTVLDDKLSAPSANGIYVYVGTEVSFEFIGSLEYNEILNGITLNGETKALSDTFTAELATTYTLEADIDTKPTVSVTINANQFTLYDAAGDIKADFFNPTTLQLMVGVEYTITFNGSENVYWVNGDNSIVGTAPEFTFVPTEAVEVKAITYGGGKYVIVLNGPAVAGTTVSYNNPVNAFVSMPALPTTIAGKTVSGWLVNGEAVEGDVVEYIKKAADALYVLTPVYSYADPIVVVINGKDTTVTPGKIHTVTADATIVVEEVTKYFTGWVVKDGETVVYETASLQLVYNFAKAGLVAEAQYSANEADKAVEEPTVTIGVDGTSVFGHYYNPNGTITSLGIIYSTSNTVEDGVLQGNVKNKDNIDDNEKTAMWNFKVAGEKTVYVQAYMTYIDAVTGQLVTVYSEVASFTTTA